MTPWFQGRLAALDFETSSKLPMEAFIVTGCLAIVGGGQVTDPLEWLLSPGDREIPAEAVAIHKVSTEFARASGRDHKDGVAHIVHSIASVLASGAPLVGHNISYDLTVLEQECLREGIPTLADTIGGPIRPVIDSMVLDKHVAPFRRRVSKTQGAYQLRTTAETYGLPWDDEKAHGATFDALASVRAVYKMGSIAHRPHVHRPDWVRALRTQQFDDLAGLTVEELHDRQMVWAHEQETSTAAHFAEKDRAEAQARGEEYVPKVEPRGWPVKAVAS